MCQLPKVNSNKLPNRILVALVEDNRKLRSMIARAAGQRFHTRNLKHKSEQGWPSLLLLQAHSARRAEVRCDYIRKASIFRS
jgi:hypothetical protein